MGWEDILKAIDAERDAAADRDQWVVVGLLEGLKAHATIVVEQAAAAEKGEEG